MSVGYLLCNVRVSPVERAEVFYRDPNNLIGSRLHGKFSALSVGEISVTTVQDGWYHVIPG